MEKSVSPSIRTRIDVSYRSPIASCMSLAATVLSTPPLTAPITRPFCPQISLMREISFPMNSSLKGECQCYQTTRTSMDANETCHCPVCFASTDTEDEARDDCFAPWAMSHLGMELDTIDRLRVVSYRRKRCSLRLANDMEIFRKILELISMGHPNLVGETACGRCGRDVM